MKKKIFSAFALFLVLIVLSGCQGIHFGRNDNKKDKVDLTYFGYKADKENVGAIEDAIQSFQKTHKNVNIMYESIKGTQYYGTLETCADTGNLYDMFMLDHDNSLKFIKKGYVENLSDIVDPSKFVSLAADQFVNEDGSIYFVPTTIVTFGLYCNMDLLRANGFEHSPRNYAELAEMCNYFVQKEQNKPAQEKKYAPIVANNTTTVRTLVLAKGMYEIYQQPNYNELIQQMNTGEKDIMDYMRPGMEMVDEMLRKGWIDGSEGATTGATSDDLALFKAGNRPFMITGAWASCRIAGQVNFEYEICPYPIMDDGSVLVMDVAICMSVNAKGEHKDIAKEFVSHMIDPEVIWHYCDSQSSFTPIKGDNRLPTDKAILPQLEYFNNGRLVIASNFNLKFHINDAFKIAGKDMMNGCTLEEALNTLERELKGN